MEYKIMKKSPNYTQKHLAKEIGCSESTSNRLRSD